MLASQGGQALRCAHSVPRVTEDPTVVSGWSLRHASPAPRAPGGRAMPDCAQVHPLA